MSTRKLIVLLTTCALLLAGCTGKKHDYIVVHYSGGQIVDVWKLRQVEIEDSKRAQNWAFTDQSGTHINVGRDIKLLKVDTNPEIWTLYHEYHRDLQGSTYEATK